MERQTFEVYMRKALLPLLFLVFPMFNACIDVPENPVFITVKNETGEAIWVTNYPFSIDVGAGMTIQVERGAEVKAIGGETKYNYGSKCFFVDPVWIVKGP
ncbi:MAG: hypothetical protein LBO80_07600 [Treponema sp.]|jgi:hypothetical protein|nr:hypothetical protein [Treponema sp.]